MESAPRHWCYLVLAAQHRARPAPAVALACSVWQLVLYRAGGVTEVRKQSLQAHWWRALSAPAWHLAAALERGYRVQGLHSIPPVCIAMVIEASTCGFTVIIIRQDALRWRQGTVFSEASVCCWLMRMHAFGYHLSGMCSTLHTWLSGALVDAILAVINGPRRTKKPWIPRQSSPSTNHIECRLR